jgi:hypothetical protein
VGNVLGLLRLKNRISRLSPLAADPKSGLSAVDGGIGWKLGSFFCELRAVQQDEKASASL